MRFVSAQNPNEGLIGGCLAPRSLTRLAALLLTATFLTACATQPGGGKCGRGFISGKVADIAEIRNRLRN
jgi:hypothetical protein